MIGRIIPYSEVFVSVTLTLDEAAALSDMVSSLKAHQDANVQKAATDLLTLLEENLERAAAYKARRAT
jgi:hypothetical protein